MKRSLTLLWFFNLNLNFIFLWTRMNKKQQTQLVSTSNKMNKFGIKIHLIEVFEIN